MGLFGENMPHEQAHFLSKVISAYHAQLSRHVSFSSKGSCWAQHRGGMETSAGAFLLSERNFQLFLFFLVFSTEDGLMLTDYRYLFLQVEDGKVSPEHYL